LILLNSFVNYISEKVFKKGKISLSKKIKNSVKKAVAYINDFELTAAEIGIDNQYSYVICGHIHQPQIKTIETAKGNICYLNSGDWIENLTALEYAGGKWELYQYREEESEERQSNEEEELDTSRLFENMVKEFQTLRAI
jgi:UDP-2,3-diacylglucosamine pyrophosphatase LpxH